MNLRSRRFQALSLLAVLACSGCARDHTHRDLVGVTSGGVDDSWLVVEESFVEGGQVKYARFIVYRCTSPGCAVVSTLRGTEGTSSAKTASSPTTIPTPPASK